jgi:hypothetical protein
VWPGTTVADNAPIAATVVAYHLGTCKGRGSYNAIEWYFPERGERFVKKFGAETCPGMKLPWKPPPPASIHSCPDFSFQAGFASDISEAGMTCSAGEALFKKSPEGRKGLASVRWRHGSFRCGGSDGLDATTSYECATPYGAKDYLLTISDG